MTDGHATEATLERMLALFDVTPLGPGRFAGKSDAGGHAGRHVVEGSQILAQAMVAAGKALSDKALPGPPAGWTVRSAHALFVFIVRSRSASAAVSRSWFPLGPMPWRVAARSTRAAPGYAGRPERPP